MADEEITNGEDKEEEEDFGALTGGEDSASSGMGHLPPLSDFDSTEGESEGDLPPLDTPESGAGDEDEGPISGLPPIVDIKVDTPAVRPSDLDTPGPAKPPETPAGFDTPTSDLDSPEPSGLGFQDFAADSDFSPETPEIGPGPDSDIETPMFDSAFGGDSELTSTPGTPAPTQAMETPMFDSQGDAGDFGFDQDAFSPATPDADAGTPVPDFSPDTGAGIESPATPTGIGDMGQTPLEAPPIKKKRGVVGLLVNLLLAVGIFAAGLHAAPWILGSLPYLPSPDAAELEENATRITQLEGQLRRAEGVKPGEEGLTPAQLDELLAQFEDATAKKNQAEDAELRAREELNALENSLALVRADIDDANDTFVEAQDFLDDLETKTAVTNAQAKGLMSENERLTEMVGELEEANARRQATKDTLLHNIDLLTVQVEGGSPLTPERFNHGDRVVRIRALRDKVARAKWVDPQLLDEYTDLYVAELGISSSREYFFARIPTTNNLGVVLHRWAECLMNGNWSVYFRTIDGKHVGSYENTAASGPSKYEFREDISSGARSDIVDAIEAARVEGYKDKIAVLRNKQKIYEDETDFQRSFSSL